MKCRQAITKISAYMDDELDAESTRQLESHLNRCTKCREVLRDFQELDGIMHGFPHIEPSPDFAAQTLIRVRKAALTGKAERRIRLSFFERIFRIIEDFVDLAGSARSQSTGTLDEFSDFPPLSMGHIYFQLVNG